MVFTNLIIPLRVQEILEVKMAVQKTNLDYEIIIKRLYHYYDIKLVTFGIDTGKNLIAQFPLFIQNCDI